MIKNVEETTDIVEKIKDAQAKAEEKSKRKRIIRKVEKAKATDKRRRRTELAKVSRRKNRRA